MAATVVDELTSASFVATGTGYLDFSNVTFNSTAEYAGNSAKHTSSAIQLRSNTSNSGIVTTASGGNVRRITVKWNSSTNASRVLDIYGKNTSYTNASDLYSAASQGTKIQSVSYSSSPVTINITGNYSYIGLRSNSGAMYIDMITIEWEVEGGVSNPTITSEQGSKFDGSQNITITPADPAHVIWYTTDGSDPVVGGATSTQYAAPFSISETTTVKAIAVDGEDKSDVVSETYTEFVTDPVINPENGTSFVDVQTVTITPAYAEHTIWYTTDGSAPQINGATSTLYTAPFSISETTTVKAIAARDEIISNVVSAQYNKRSNEYYELVTSQNEIVSGGRYLIVAYHSVDDIQEYRAMAEQGSDIRNYTTVTVEEDRIYSRGDAVEVKLVKSNDNWRLFIESENQYMALNSDANKVQTETTESDNGLTTISVAEDGVATISFTYNSTSRNLKYNSSSPRFACYKSGQTDIKLYKFHAENQGEFAIGAEGFATFFTNKSFVMPQGVEGGIITAATDGRLTISYAYAAGEIVPANTGLLLKGSAGTYGYDVTTEAATIPATGNMLYGADAVVDGQTFVAGTNVKYYVLSKNKSGENLGFYWAAADGAAVAYQPSKAFLAIDFASGSKMYSSFNLGDGTTSINSVESAKSQDGKIYTVSGVYVGKNMNALPKGLYIVNGKKVVR